MNNRNLVLLAAAAAVAGWVARKAYQARSPRSARMVTDFQGNYDLDGVSFDSQEHCVTVSGDASRNCPPPAPYVH